MSKSGKTLEQTVGFMGAILPGVSIPKITLIDGKEKYIRTATYYKAGFLNQLKSGEAVLPSDTQEVGVSTFDGNKLPKGVEALVTGVRVLFDTTAGIQTGAGVKGAAFKSEAPAVFKNGEVKVSQNGQLFYSVGSDVSNFKGVSTGNDDDFREVVPFKLRDQAAFQVLFDLAGAAAVDQAYRIELRVIEMVDSTVA